MPSSSFEKEAVSPNITSDLNDEVADNNANTEDSKKLSEDDSNKLNSKNEDNARKNVSLPRHSTAGTKSFDPCFTCDKYNNLEPSEEHRKTCAEKLIDPDNPQQCPKCNKKLSKLHGITRHLANGSCVANRQKVTIQLPITETTHEVVKESWGFSCSNCHKPFSDKSVARRHAKKCEATEKVPDNERYSRLLNDEYNCTFCDFKGLSLTGLKNHENSCSIRRHYYETNCKYCGHTDNAAAMKEHMIVCSDKVKAEKATRLTTPREKNKVKAEKATRLTTPRVKSYCEVCDKSFTRVWELKRHSLSQSHKQMEKIRAENENSMAVEASKSANIKQEPSTSTASTPSKDEEMTEPNGEQEEAAASSPPALAGSDQSDEKVAPQQTEPSSSSTTPSAARVTRPELDASKAAPASEDNVNVDTPASSQASTSEPSVQQSANAPLSAILDLVIKREKLDMLTPPSTQEDPAEIVVLQSADATESNESPPESSATVNDDMEALSNMISDLHAENDGGELIKIEDLASSIAAAELAQIASSGRVDSPVIEKPLSRQERRMLSKQALLDERQARREKRLNGEKFLQASKSYHRKRRKAQETGEDPELIPIPDEIPNYQEPSQQELDQLFGGRAETRRTFAYNKEEAEAHNRRVMEVTEARRNKERRSVDHEDSIIDLRDEPDEIAMPPPPSPATIVIEDDGPTQGADAAGGKKKLFACPVEGCRAEFTRMSNMRKHVKKEATKPRISACKKHIAAYEYYIHNVKRRSKHQQQQIDSASTSSSYQPSASTSAAATTAAYREETPFVCFRCPEKTFLTSTCLHDHYVKHFTKGIPAHLCRCGLCSFGSGRGVRLNELMLHLVKNHDFRIDEEETREIDGCVVKCPDCDLEFPSQRDFKEHYIAAHPCGTVRTVLKMASCFVQPQANEEVAGSSKMAVKRRFTVGNKRGMPRDNAEPSNAGKATKRRATRALPASSENSSKLTARRTKELSNKKKESSGTKRKIAEVDLNSPTKTLRAADDAAASKNDSDSGSSSNQNKNPRAAAAKRRLTMTGGSAKKRKQASMERANDDASELTNLELLCGKCKKIFTSTRQIEFHIFETMSGSPHGMLDPTDQITCVPCGSSFATLQQLRQHLDSSAHC